MGCWACIRPEASGAAQGLRLGAALSALCLLSALALLEWLGPPAETVCTAAARLSGRERQVRGAGQRLRGDRRGPE